MNQLPTGIPGLDRVLQGGLLEGHSVLVQGTPGAGKTTLGMQFIYQGIVQFDQPGLIITFEEYPEQMYREALNFGWDLRALQDQGKLAVLATSPGVFRDQFSDSQGMIQKMTRDMQVRRILVDSVSHFQRIEQDPVRLRELLASLLNALKQGGYTTLLTQEVGHEEGGEVSFEQYVVDVVMRIFFTTFRHAERRRAVEVLKARGQSFVSGKHVVHISGQGVRVYPRPAPETDPMDASVAVSGEAPKRLSTGIYGLDRMLDGGVVESSSTLIAGDPGSGKTLLTLQFLSAGVQAGEAGLYVALRQDPRRLFESVKSIGMNLDPFVDQNLLHVLRRSPVDLDPDQFYWELREFLETHSVRRVVIDSLSDLEPSLGDPKRLRDYVYAMIDLFTRNRITAMVVRQAGGEAEDQTEFELSMVFDTILSLRLHRVQEHLRKTISLMKVHGTSHDTGLRTIKISTQGFIVETKFEPTSAFLQKLQQSA